MLGEIGLELVIIVLLTLANGFFAGSEIAIVSARRSRLEARAEEGSISAKQALKLADSPDRFLATVQVGITMIGTFSAAFGGARIGDVLAQWLSTIPLLAPYAETLGLFIVVIGVSYLSLILGELVPKRLALKNAEGLAVIAAPIMTLLSKVARPLVGLLTLSVNGVMRLLGQSGSDESTVTEEDIVYMVKEGTESGSVRHEEAQFIRQVFDFSDRPVVSVMTPRTELVTVDVTDSVPDIIETFVQSGYSRLPVYEDTVDHIIGIIYAKDLMRVALKPEKPVDIRALVRPISFIPESMHTPDVLAIFRKSGTHMVVVLDEYGQTAGVATFEDLLEELVGEIRDEYDQSESQKFVQRADGSWLVDGLEAFDKVEQRLNLELPEDIDRSDFTTLAGLIMVVLGRIPETGDVVDVGSHRYEVIDMDGRRVDKVLIRPVDKNADDSKDS